MAKMTKAKSKATKTPVDRKTIRELIREELRSFTGTLKELFVSKQIDRDPYAAEAPPSAGEAEAYAPIHAGVEARLEAGMNRDLAEVLTKIDRGIDPTPMGFELPQPYSYFTGYPQVENKPEDADSKWEPRKTFRDGEAFKAAFLTAVKEGKSQGEAYIATCQAFGLPTLEKLTLEKKILNELPDRPGGAFQLGAGEYAMKQGLPLLTRKSDE